jgi:seryl-tRNA synthetase
MPLKIDLFRNPDTVTQLKENQLKRGKPIELIDDIIKLDESWRKLQFTLNQTNKDINLKQKDMAKLMKDKKKDTDECKQLLAELTTMRNNVTDIENEIKSKALECQKKIGQVGNMLDPDVPIAQDEKDNKVLRKWTTDKALFQPTEGEQQDNKTKFHHHELLKMIDGFSPEKGVALTGHRGYFLKGYGVLLNQALINYGLEFLTNREYCALQPPFFMKKEIMAKTAQLEQFDEELYHVSGNQDDYYLIATSEQPISAYHQDEQLMAKDLPLKYAGISTCFRKEAGSYGKDVSGLFRIHQFEKVEQFVITEPSKSNEMLEQMIGTSELFYQSLGLPYRVISIVSGALNNAAAKKYDLEAWFPKYGNYRELVSASNCTDYQALPMNTYIGNGPNKQYVHFLNCTLAACERTLCCILENYQTDEGIVIPEVLRKYMNGKELIKFV